MKYYKQKQQTTLEREKLHAILGDKAIDIILIALEWAKHELNQFPDRQQEFGPELTIKATDIEPIAEFLRYG